jgi:hypothetical protein
MISLPTIRSHIMQCSIAKYALKSIKIEIRNEKVLYLKVK